MMTTHDDATKAHRGKWEKIKREPTTKELESSSSISHFSHPGCWTRGLLCSRWFIIKETWLSLLYTISHPSFIYTHRARESYIFALFSPLVYSLFSCWPQHFNTTNHNHLTWRKKSLLPPFFPAYIVTIYSDSHPTALPFLLLHWVVIDGSASSIRHVVHLRSNEPIAATDVVGDINSSPAPLPVVQKSIFIPPFPSPIAHTHTHTKVI